MLKPRLGIRSQILLVALVLLAVPWVGLSFVREMERFLRAGHEQAVAATAQALATALHDRPQLFEAQAGLPSPWSEPGDLYLFALPAAIELDGSAADWPSAVVAHRYTATNGDEATPDTSTAPNTAGPAGPNAYDSPRFELRIGQYGAYLYALMEVRQTQIHYRLAPSMQVANADHVELSFTTPEGEFRRYAVSPLRPGSGNAYSLRFETGQLVLDQIEPRIRASWRETPRGYNVEIAVPLSLLGEKLAFGIASLPTSDNGIATWMSTSTLTQRAGMGSLIIPSPEIQQVVQGLARTTSRIRVLDKNQRVIAETGSLKRAQAAIAPPPAGFFARLKAHTLDPLYARLLTPVSEEFTDEAAQDTRAILPQLDSALRGIAQTGRRKSTDGRAVIVTSAYPVWAKDQVLGAVVVEETTNALVSLRNAALTSLMNSVLAVFALVALVLLAFASRLSYRIRKLRDEADAAIDDQGRLQNKLEQSARAQDEIGDLSRSFSTVLQRLAHHHHYLENLAARLSHELRTPITVVRSSLDNLDQQALAPDAEVYVARAQQGVQRLSTVLTRMTEARQLEQALQHNTRERFDLVAVVESCMAAYRDAYPQTQFHLRLPAIPLPISGGADLIAQMLDKLISNAVDFHTPGSAIDVALTQAGEQARLSVANEGPLLPPNMAEQLFFSMVSVREPATSSEPHLGLGLYIVRLIALYHGGTARAENRADGAGVVLRIDLALAAAGF